MARRIVLALLLALIALPALAGSAAETSSPAGEAAGPAAAESLHILDLDTFLRSLAEPAAPEGAERRQLAGSCGADGICVHSGCLHGDPDCLCQPAIDCGQDSDCPANGYCYMECAVCYCD